MAVHDPYKMDSNKMKWHPERVAQWMSGGKIAPIALDCGITKRCNPGFACRFCIAYTQGTGFDEGDVIPEKALLDFVEDAAEIGVKSIAWIGDGEPTLNPAWLAASDLGYRLGMDMAISTNGIAFNPGRLINCFKWARFNISAGTKEGYSYVHTCKPDVYDLVLSRISDAVANRNLHGPDTTIGLQMVPMPDYLDEVIPLAKLGRELGVDYLVIKQCCVSDEGILGPEGQKLEAAVSEEAKRVYAEAEKLSTPSYKVIVKWDRIETNAARRYPVCYGTRFVSQLSGDGKLYTCGPHFGKKRFELLDITKERLVDVFNSDRWEWVHDEAVAVNICEECNSSCRQDSVNEYLYDLKDNKPQHVNFV